MSPGSTPHWWMHFPISLKPTSRFGVLVGYVVHGFLSYSSTETKAARGICALGVLTHFQSGKATKKASELIIHFSRKKIETFSFFRLPSFPTFSEHLILIIYSCTFHHYIFITISRSTATPQCGASFSPTFSKTFFLRALFWNLSRRFIFQDVCNNFANVSFAHRANGLVEKRLTQLGFENMFRNNFFDFEQSNTCNTICGLWLFHVL